MTRMSFVVGIFIPLLTCSLLSRAGEISCDCPPGERSASPKPDTVFLFSNGRQIALCGYHNKDERGTALPAFALSVCSAGKTLGWWKAEGRYSIAMHEDTLYVDELIRLPAGDNMSELETVWATDRIWMEKSQVIRQFAVRRDLPVYTQPQITEVLASFETSDDRSPRFTIELAKRLFVAMLSGDKKAGEYFAVIRNRLEADAVLLNEYEDLSAKLILRGSQTRNNWMVKTRLGKKS